MLDRLIIVFMGLDPIELVLHNMWKKEEAKCFILYHEVQVQCLE